jgi:ATP-dependent Clp protease ATP-binding subunit ClpB
MTSNLGSNLIQEKFDMAARRYEKAEDKWDVRVRQEIYDQAAEDAKKVVMEMLKQTIRPEFLNRIDEIVMFAPLNEQEIHEIVRLQITSVQKMLKENSIELNVTDAAVDFLSKAGYDPEYGARPVKRAIQRYLLNDLSKRILAGEVNSEHPIKVDAQGNEIVFKN